MNFKLIASVDRIGDFQVLSFPQVVKGRMYVYGGQVGEIRYNVTGENLDIQSRRLALFLARLSNKFAETEIILNLPQVLIKRLQALLNREAPLTARIGFRLNEIKILSAAEQWTMEPDRIHQRPISPAILQALPKDANTTVALAFGATNFRFQLIQDGKVIGSKRTPAQFYKVSASDREAILDEPGLLTAGEKDLFREALICIDHGDKQGNERSLTPKHREVLRKVQLFRITQGIDSILANQGLPIDRVRGFAFTCAGIVNMETGLVMAENIPGFEDVIGGINIAQELEGIYTRPVISLNDVDSEIAALIRSLKITYECRRTEKPVPLEHFQFIATALQLHFLPPHQRMIITGYGGGTGIGGVQIGVMKDNDGNLKIEILTGRYQSAGEHGHDLMDPVMPEVARVRAKAIEEGIPEEFIDAIFEHIRSTTCVWCGNNFDLEKVASGAAGADLGRFLLKYYTGKDAIAYREIITRNHADTSLHVEDLLNVIDTSDVITMYKEKGNKEAEHALRIMAKFWATHMVMTYKDGLQIFTNGNSQKWETFFITQGMFRASNEFFRDWVMESLEKDFVDENGHPIDYTKIFDVVFLHDDDNQALGSDEVLKAEIERQK